LRCIQGRIQKDFEVFEISSFKIDPRAFPIANLLEVRLKLYNIKIKKNL
jgi:hypothetical protein